MPRRSPLALAHQSFLRRVDARTKLALAMGASSAVMLPLAPLALFVAGFAALVVVGRLVAPAAAQVRRVAPLLGLLFAIDWLVVGLPFAVLITLRVALLVTAFTVLVATTTPDELRAGLERLGLPPRLAFAMASTYRSLAQMEREWQTIIEAQRARGLLTSAARTRSWRLRLSDAVALVVPAIVLATQRAWALSESAAGRGLESPLRRPHGVHSLTRLDRALLAGAGGLLLVLLAWR